MIQAAKSANVRVRTQRWKDYYSFKESCLLLTNIINPTTRKIEFGRDLDYGFSLTSHKSQGSTFDTSFVDVNDIVYDKYGNPYTDAEEINRRLYVACSRCKINYILNMENNKDYSNEVLAVEETTTEKKLVNVVVKSFL